MLNQLDRLIAKKNGFNELLFYGDDLEFVTAGIVVAEKTLAQNPEMVRRFVRGTLRGFLWLKSSEKEAVARFTTAMKVSENEATEVYKSALRVMSTDGTIPRGLQQNMIAFQRRSLKIERDVQPEQVYDFTMVRAINDELRKNR